MERLCSRSVETHPAESQTAAAFDVEIVSHDGIGRNAIGIRELRRVIADQPQKPSLCVERNPDGPSRPEQSECDLEPRTDAVIGGAGCCAALMDKEFAETRRFGRETAR